MKKLLITLSLSCLIIGGMQAQNIIYPAIQGYGGVIEVPFETIKPDPNESYKFVIEISNRIDDKKEVAGILDYASRMYNLHIYAGVPKENIDLAIVIFSGATPISLSNEEYQKRFEVTNPNAEVLEEMKRNGIRLIVCGQSMMKQGLVPEMIFPGVEMAVSRFTATSDLMKKGYQLFVL